MKARPRIPPEKDQRDRGVKAVSTSPLCSTAQSLFQLPCWAESQRQCPLHCCEEQPEAKEVQLSQPSFTSLLMIYSGLIRGSSSTSLLLISPGTLSPGCKTHGPIYRSWQNCVVCRTSDQNLKLRMAGHYHSAQ